MNLLINNSLQSQFQISPTSPHSSVSRELYEDLYFHYRLKAHSLETTITHFPNPLIANFEIAFNQTRLKTKFLVNSWYGYPNIIGKDLLHLFSSLTPTTVNPEPSTLTPDPSIINHESLIINHESLIDSMARLRYYHNTHSSKPTYDVNVAFYDIQTVIDCAQYHLNLRNYDKTISLLSTLEPFIEHKLYRDISDPLRMGASLTARFFLILALALHHSNLFADAEHAFLHAKTLYPLESPIGSQIYNTISHYPY